MIQLYIWYLALKFKYFDSKKKEMIVNDKII